MIEQTTALEARGLSRRFDDEAAVDAVDLAVAGGEIVAIVGLNGAGKTTLMRLLLGMLRPDFGEARILGEPVESAGPEVWSRVGHLIEFPFAYDELTVVENLRSAALLHGSDPEKISGLVDGAVRDFELGRWAGRRAGTLSLGNRQRLGLASATIHAPSILILDEPANALDPAGVVFIRDLLRSKAAEGAAVLVSSHHLDELARIADRIVVLHRGREIGSIDPSGVDLERQFFELVYEREAALGGSRE